LHRKSRKLMLSKREALCERIVKYRMRNFRFHIFNKLNNRLLYIYPCVKEILTATKKATT
jgi:hypothetical protein